MNAVEKRPKHLISYLYSTLYGGAIPAIIAGVYAHMSQDITTESLAEILASETGEPVEKFRPPEDVEYPPLEDLESVPNDE
jgi:hypothetical protein